MMRRHLESRWLFALNVAVYGAVVVAVALPMLGRLAVDRLTTSTGDCPYRVSASGTIHGPDSPYRAMVPPSRCHPTRAAAEAALQQR